MAEEETASTHHDPPKTHTWQSGSNDGKCAETERATQSPKQPFCPQCGSTRLYKDGLRYLADGTTIQRWLCRNCGYRFSERKPLQRNRDWQINTASALFSKRQVCELLTRESKNLDATEIQTVAGEKPTQSNSKGRFIEYIWHIQKQGYKSAQNRIVMIKRLLDLGANLDNPETIKDILAKQKTWSEGYKMLMVYAYENYLHMIGLTWARPRYKQNITQPFIPTEEELNALITGSGKQLGTFLQGLKDTGADPGELAQLKWIDINFEARRINIKPVKGHKPRYGEVTPDFIRRVKTLSRHSEYVFNYKSLKSCYKSARKKLARNLSNPRLLEISFKTFRHWKGTMEYHRTHDIIYVKELLGHKRIENTMIYINLEKAIFSATNDEYYSAVAKNAEEACRLTESGFEYVTGEYNDGGKIFRKRK